MHKYLILLVLVFSVEALCFKETINESFDNNGKLKISFIKEKGSISLFYYSKDKKKRRVELSSHIKSQLDLEKVKVRLFSILSKKGVSAREIASVGKSFEELTEKIVGNDIELSFSQANILKKKSKSIKTLLELKVGGQSIGLRAVLGKSHEVIDFTFALPGKESSEYDLKTKNNITTLTHTKDGFVVAVRRDKSRFTIFIQREHSHGPASLTYRKYALRLVQGEWEAFSNYEKKTKVLSGPRTYLKESFDEAKSEKTKDFSLREISSLFEFGQSIHEFNDILKSEFNACLVENEQYSDMKADIEELCYRRVAIIYIFKTSKEKRALRSCFVKKGMIEEIGEGKFSYRELNFKKEKFINKLNDCLPLKDGYQMIEGVRKGPSEKITSYFFVGLVQLDASGKERSKEKKKELILGAAKKLANDVYHPCKKLKLENKSLCERFVDLMVAPKLFEASLVGAALETYTDCFEEYPELVFEKVRKGKWSSEEVDEFHSRGVSCAYRAIKKRDKVMVVNSIRENLKKLKILSKYLEPSYSLRLAQVIDGGTITYRSCIQKMSEEASNLKEFIHKYDEQRKICLIMSLKETALTLFEDYVFSDLLKEFPVNQDIKKKIEKEFFIILRKTFEGPNKLQSIGRINIYLKEVQYLVLQSYLLHFREDRLRTEFRGDGIYVPHFQADDYDDYELFKLSVDMAQNDLFELAGKEKSVGNKISDDYVTKKDLKMRNVPKRMRGTPTKLHVRGSTRIHLIHYLNGEDYILNSLAHAKRSNVARVKFKRQGGVEGSHTSSERSVTHRRLKQSYLSVGLAKHLSLYVDKMRHKESNDALNIKNIGTRFIKEVLISEQIWKIKQRAALIKGFLKNPLKGLELQQLYAKELTRFDIKPDTSISDVIDYDKRLSLYIEGLVEVEEEEFFLRRRAYKKGYLDRKDIDLALRPTLFFKKCVEEQKKFLLGENQENEEEIKKRFYRCRFLTRFDSNVNIAKAIIKDQLKYSVYNKTKEAVLYLVYEISSFFRDATNRAETGNSILSNELSDASGLFQAHLTNEQKNERRRRGYSTKIGSYYDNRQGSLINQMMRANLSSPIWKKDKEIYLRRANDILRKVEANDSDFLSFSFLEQQLKDAESISDLVDSSKISYRSADHETAVGARKIFVHSISNDQYPLSYLSLSMDTLLASVRRRMREGYFKRLKRNFPSHHLIAGGKKDSLGSILDRELPRLLDDEMMGYIKELPKSLPGGSKNKDVLTEKKALTFIVNFFKVVGKYISQGYLHNPEKMKVLLSVVADDIKKSFKYKRIIKGKAIKYNDFRENLENSEIVDRIGLAILGNHFKDVMISFIERRQSADYKRFDKKHSRPDEDERAIRRLIRVKYNKMRQVVYKFYSGDNYDRLFNLGKKGGRYANYFYTLKKDYLLPLLKGEKISKKILKEADYLAVMAAFDSTSSDALSNNYVAEKFVRAMAQYQLDIKKRKKWGWVKFLFYSKSDFDVSKHIGKPSYSKAVERYADQILLEVLGHTKLLGYEKSDTDLKDLIEDAIDERDDISANKFGAKAVAKQKKRREQSYEKKSPCQIGLEMGCR